MFSNINLGLDCGITSINVDIDLPGTITIMKPSTNMNKIQLNEDINFNDLNLSVANNNVLIISLKKSYKLKKISIKLYLRNDITKLDLNANIVNIFNSNFNKDSLIICRNKTYLTLTGSKINNSEILNLGTGNIKLNNCKCKSIYFLNSNSGNIIMNDEYLATESTIRNLGTGSVKLNTTGFTKIYNTSKKSCYI